MSILHEIDPFAQSLSKRIVDTENSKRNFQDRELAEIFSYQVQCDTSVEFNFAQEMAVILLSF